ncbi:MULTISPECIES: alanine racemase [unclassified Actinopolyspora]|uniref:alanine racemase n=1 Tax=unclassified Actinopolyspora TaxID=2639451 RepID=UPI0013F62B13|nr:MULTISPECIES: alanine racemase [unclassified Actinopolyspora]NHD19417.1 alanine racemase [Actinopolyspora sp. BKK2]NHE78510.1 alanine racemase [Actinopolyspora sp. BKK1]
MSAPAARPRHPPRTTTGPRSPLLEIDLSAVAANTRHFTHTTGGEVMAVVKADGFGHGLDRMARTALANGATWLGATSIAEAVQARAADADAPVLSWLNPVDADVTTACEHRIDLAVPSGRHLAAVVESCARSGHRARVHLQLDTGMARDGAAPHEWPELMSAARHAERAGHITVEGVMGHLPRAGEPGPSPNTTGRQEFLRGVALAEQAGLRPSVRHLAATAATLTDPDTHLDLIRIGAGLAGIDPSGSTRLHPALRLTAPVVQVRRVPAGTGIGYGHTHVTDRATNLALLPIGYADGVPRAASNRARITVAGRRCPVVGMISMDQLVADLGDQPVEPDTAAVVFGPGEEGEPTVDDWARWADTIPHEIVTGIGHRVRRSMR